MRTGRQCRGLGWDHPRVGGEKHLSGTTDNRPQGSPPRGRGKAFSVLRRQFRFRITPAWAGKRAASDCKGEKHEDHPRMGGEKWHCVYFCRHPRGSPPHGRGKVKTSRLLTVAIRITPAWAGKRLPFSSLPHTYWDHPRMGGEKLHLRMPFSTSLGSPPHGRGKAF